MMLTKTICIIFLISVTKHIKKNQLKGNRISFDSFLEKGCMVGKAWQWEWEATVTLYRQDAESEDC